MAIATDSNMQIPWRAGNARLVNLSGKLLGAHVAHAGPAAPAALAVRPGHAVLVDDGGGGHLGPGGVGRQHGRGRHDEGVSQHHGVGVC